MYERMYVRMWMGNMRYLSMYVCTYIFMFVRMYVCCTVCTCVRMWVCEVILPMLYGMCT
jgi:hypothetical protein